MTPGDGYLEWRSPNLRPKSVLSAAIGDNDLTVKVDQQTTGRHSKKI